MNGAARQFRILAISGSLRARSSNTIVLQAAAALTPDNVEVVMYAGLAELPHFNPDLDRSLDDVLPPAATELRTQVGRADALLICSPEYAHGVPGSLKNALDWLVGGAEMPGKPVGVINASFASTHAHAQLIETLTTMSARVVPDACVTLSTTPKNLDIAGIVASPSIAPMLRGVLGALVAEAAAVDNT